MSKKQVACIIWILSFLIYLSLIVVVYIFRIEFLLVPTVIMMMVCVIEEMFLYDIEKWDTSTEIITTPILAVLVIPILATLCCTGFTMLGGNAFHVIAILIAITMAIVRRIVRRRDDKSEKGIAIYVYFMLTLIIYFISATSFYSVVNCELDGSAPERRAATVIEKGYTDASLLGFSKELTIAIDCDEYGEAFIPVTEEEFKQIEVGTKIFLNVGCGTLKEKYIYYGDHRWGYSVAKSTLFNKEFKNLMKENKDLSEADI